MNDSQAVARFPLTDAHRELIDAYRIPLVLSGHAEEARVCADLLAAGEAPDLPGLVEVIRSDVGRLAASEWVEVVPEMVDRLRAALDAVDAL